jgi:hypothetical protein
MGSNLAEAIDLFKTLENFIFKVLKEGQIWDMVFDNKFLF